ncbi:hypothetical protein VTN77DRAFT_2206 [Rasamsonia byssochlamydoides]|uniref:uncharacterized protein n=1 Tax=Rasamsonia byssochlamydoides TaxID=89139 RepID=UPI003744AFD9
MSAEHIQSLVADINRAAETYTPEVNPPYLSTATSRHQLLAAARKLVTALEDPEEEVWRFVLQPGAHACAIAAWQCRLLAPWPKERMTAAELAGHVNVDQVLVVRIMRALQHYGIFSEVEEEVYEHNAFSTRLSTPPINQSALPMAIRIREIAKLPEYLAHIAYRNPGADPSQPSLFQWANNTDLEFFQWMQTQTQSDTLAKFNAAMATSIETERANSSGKTFLDIYPFERVLADAQPEETVVVDVGGGYGHLLREIRRQHPQIRGKMVLEDLPETVKGAVVGSADNVDIQPYDFFAQEQPVRGARLYILRHVLHDWSDHACRQILKNTIPALVQGKSKILLVEVVLPPTNASVWGSLMDINMMKYSGMGRKERQWRELLESVGLEIVRIWPPVKNDSVMEVVPKGWVER